MSVGMEPYSGITVDNVLVSKLESAGAFEIHRQTADDHTLTIVDHHRRHPAMHHQRGSLSDHLDILRIFQKNAYIFGLVSAIHSHQ